MGCIVSVFGVEPFRIGGTEAFARELSLQLDRMGWQSVLCFLTPPSAEVLHFLDLPNVVIEVVPNIDKGNLKGLKELWRVLSKHRPYLLHLHFLGFLGFYPWLSKLRSVRKVFFTDHSSRPSGYESERAPYWKRQLIRLINLPIDRVLCVSQYGLKSILKLDVLPVARFQLIYNGVDIARIVPNANQGRRFKERFQIPEERAVILQVSWIIPEKGIGDLLRVASLVIEKNDKVQFVFVGEGPYREQYMNEVDPGIADHITWTGLIENPLGEGVYDAAEIVCQLSRWEEVFGWMIAEAMVYSKPLVATRVGGIPELIEHNTSGFLVPRGDVAATADHILDLLSNEALRMRMGAAARARACSEFDLQANVKQLLQAYDLHHTN